METIIELANRLRKEGEDVDIFFGSLPLTKWHTKVYTGSEGWTVKQLLAHFIAAERGFIELIPSVIGGGEGTPLEFNINEYNHSSVSEMDNLPTEALLQEFHFTRQKSIRLILALSDDDFDKVGRHPFLGFAPVRDMIKLIYNHNRLHLRDARRSIKSLDAS